MAKTILELFQTQNLANGKTAEETYAIRDIKKELKNESKNVILNATAFKGQNLLRKRLSVKGKETRFEQEVTGLHALMLLAGPGIYGTEYFRVKTKTTDSRDVMVESTRAGVGGNRGLLGGVLKFIKNGPKKLGTLLGANFPEQMIPSRFVERPEFKAGESDLYEQIAKIKKASEGNGFGRFLQKNVSGTFEQVGNQVLSGALSAGKKAVENALFGSRKAGAVRLGSKPEGKRYYDVKSIYSDVVDEENTDVTLRTDLSTKFHVLRKFSKIDTFFPIRLQKFFAKRLDEKSKNTNNKILSYAYQTPYLGENIYNYRNTINYLAGRATDFLNSKKPGIVNIGRQLSGKSEDYLYTSITDDGLPIPYTTTVDFDTIATPVPINERNDLTTYLKGYIDFENGFPVKKSTRGVGINDKGVPGDMGNYQPYSKRNGTPNTQGYDLQRGITDYREIRNGSDLMNAQGPNASTTYTSKINGVNKTLDEIDFIRLKFASKHSGRYAYFRGTISAYSETYSPSYAQHQGIGMAYPLYTFESIERTIQFNFKVYSLNAKEHIACWERLQFLASLTMPQGFTATQATIPPIVKFWLGDMFVDRTVYIENLNFTTDVNFPWEIGLNATDVECYKLPMIIDVSTTIHLIDDVSDTTSAKAMYDFDATNVIKRSTNPAIASAIAAQNQSANIPTTTVTSSPKKKIPSAQTIPTISAKPIKLADVNIPKKLPTIPNIQPLESMGTNQTGGTPVGSGVPATPQAPSQPATPPTPIPTPDITKTPVGDTNSTSKAGVADIPKELPLKFAGEVEIIGKATSRDSNIAMQSARKNAIDNAATKLGLAGSFSVSSFEVDNDNTAGHLYKNKDGTYTYESTFKVTFTRNEK
jgi:hypothetical protein